MGFLDSFRNPNTHQLQLTGEGPRLFFSKHGAKLAAGLVATIALASLIARNR